MALPSTTTRPLLFVTRRPAWEKEVRLDQGMASTVFTADAGLEQRQQKRNRCQFRMTYNVVYAQPDQVERDARNAAEILSPLVVPFWTERARTASIVSSTVLINRPATPDFFAPGDYVFFDDGTQQQFRMVEAINPANAQQITLEAMSGAIAFASGTKIYPCRFCVRTGGDAPSDVENEGSTSEEISYSTL